MSLSTRIDISQWSKEAQVEYRALEKESEDLRAEIAVIKDKMVNAKEEGKTRIYNKLDMRILVLRREKTNLTNKMRYRAKKDGNATKKVGANDMHSNERIELITSLKEEREKLQIDIKEVRLDIQLLKRAERNGEMEIEDDIRVKNKALAGLINSRQNLSSRIVYHSKKLQ